MTTLYRVIDAGEELAVTDLQVLLQPGPEGVERLVPLHETELGTHDGTAVFLRPVTADDIAVIHARAITNDPAEMRRYADAINTLADAIDRGRA